jgi:hypothetical protein
MRVIGKFIETVATICLFLTSLWAFILCLGIINRAAGFWGVVIGFAVAPVTFVAAPWYALAAHRELDALVIGYGGVLVFGSVKALGHFLSERQSQG